MRQRTTNHLRRQLSAFCCFAAVIVFLLSAPAAVRAETVTPLGEDVFQIVRPSVFQIKTAPGPNAPKTSYGSGFVVNKKGLLITNYHVVSEALHEPEQYRIYIVAGEKNIEAKVLSFSVRHDIALITADHRFKKALTLSPKAPQNGARIFSMGIPEDLNMSIIEGVYNGVVKHGPYDHIHMSAPLNSGMSGGPTVNRKGDVIGVNVASMIWSENISFAVPVRHVRRLISKKRDPKRDLTDKKTLHSVIEAQLMKIQHKLGRSWNKPSGAPLVLGGWAMRRPAKYLKCWSGKDADPKDHYQWTTRSCHLNGAAYLRQRTTSGSYRMEYKHLENKKLTSWQLITMLDDSYNDGPGSYESFLMNAGSGDDEVHTKYDCRNGIVEGKGGGYFLMNYCLTGYLHYPELYHADVKFIELDGRDQRLLMQAKLAGFTLDNIEMFLQTHINSVRWVGSSDDQKDKG